MPRMSKGRTALIWAVARPVEPAARAVEPAVLQALVDGGADVNLTDNRGETAMFGLVRYLQHTLTVHTAADDVRILINAGADPNARNAGGLTPLALVTYLPLKATLEAQGFTA